MAQTTQTSLAAGWGFSLTTVTSLLWSALLNFSRYEQCLNVRIRLEFVDYDATWLFDGQIKLQN